MAQKLRAVIPRTLLGVGSWYLQTSDDPEFSKRALGSQQLNSSAFEVPIVRPEWKPQMKSESKNVDVIGVAPANQFPGTAESSGILRLLNDSDGHRRESQ